MLYFYSQNQQNLIFTGKQFQNIIILIWLQSFFTKDYKQKVPYKQSFIQMKEKLILASVALLIQILKLFKNRAKFISKLNLLNIVRQLAEFSPTQLIKNFDKLQDYGICVGKAFASQKCTAFLKPTKSVIISKLYELSNYNFRGELQQFKKLIRIKRPTFFTLNDKFSSIPIIETVKLPTITTRNVMQSNNPSKKFYIDFVISLVNVFKNVQIQFTSQTNIVESYLPEGTRVAILGKFKREAAGNICCDNPIMMAVSKGQLLQKIQLKISQLKFEKYALIFGITACLGFACRLIYRYVIDERKRKQDPVNKLQNTIYVKSRVCSNCHENLSNFIVESCGHLSLCKQCKEKIGICVQCKNKAQNGLELYAC